MYSVRNIGKFLDTSDLPAEEKAAIIERATAKAKDNIISFDDLDYVLGQQADNFRAQSISPEQLELARQDLKKFLK